MEYFGEAGGHQISKTVYRMGEEMEALRHSNLNGKIMPSTAGINPTVSNQQGQGLVAILVMIVVLIFILAYCCWGAPCCRSICHRCFYESESNVEAPQVATQYNIDQCASTPTIILLPYGRMLVVDGAVFAQFQADTTGLDLLELGESVVRAQQNQMITPNSLTSTPSILEIDSETNSKDFNLPSPVSSLPPPTYESLFGEFQNMPLPPSYSETFQEPSTTEEEEDDDDEFPVQELTCSAQDECEVDDIRESTV